MSGITICSTSRCGYYCFVVVAKLVSKNCATYRTSLILSTGCLSTRGVTKCGNYKRVENFMFCIKVLFTSRTIVVSECSCNLTGCKNNVGPCAVVVVIIVYGDGFGVGVITVVVLARIGLNTLSRASGSNGDNACVIIVTGCCYFNVNSP